jgi:AraC-like DNA-binding protein
MSNPKPSDSSRSFSIQINHKIIESIELAKKLIEENFTKRYTQKILCKLTGLNQYKFKKAFKILVGVSARQYQVQVKIERAKIILLETDDYIWEIALSLGYEHAQNFSMQFKRRVGSSPKKWRKHEKIRQASPPWIP